MSGYWLYALLVLAGFRLWLALFVIMRRGAGRKRDVAGYVLIGPMHAYLKRRGYSLSARELIGSGVVLLLMLVVPWITWFLER